MHLRRLTKNKFLIEHTHRMGAYFNVACNEKDKSNHVDVNSASSSLNLKIQPLRLQSKPSEHLIFLFLLVLLSFFAVLQLGRAADATDLSRLRRDLLTGYDKNARPIQNHQNATIVRFSIYLKGFEFDELRSTFTLHSWSVLSWKDEHIKWDPKAYGNITRIHFASHELWTPDLSVFNNLDKSEIDHFGNTRILAYNNSLIVWVPPTKFQVGCTSNLRNWPVDTQTCFVVIGSWAHDGSMIDIKLPVNQTTMDASDMAKNREWKLIANSMKKRVQYFAYPPIPFPDVLLTFVMEREGATHKAAIVVPGLAIAMGVLIAFWIQPGATERLVLLLVCLINNTMYLSYIYRMLPNNGDSVPLVLLYYRDSLFMIAVALIWTVILRYLASSKRTSPVPLPGFIQSFLTSLPAKLLCLDPRPAHSSQNNGVRPSGEMAASDPNQDTGKLVGGGNAYQEDWAWLAHLLDRVAFVIYLVLYLVFYMALL